MKNLLTFWFLVYVHMVVGQSYMVSDENTVYYYDVPNNIPGAFVGVEINAITSGKVIVEYTGVIERNDPGLYIFGITDELFTLTPEFFHLFNRVSEESCYLSFGDNDSGVSRKNYTHTRVFDVGPGQYNFYGEIQRIDEWETDEVVQYYSAKLTAKFIPDVDQVYSEAFDLENITITDETVLSAVNVEVDEPSWVRVKLDGNMISSAGDRILLAAMDSPNVYPVNHVSYEAESSEDGSDNRVGFSHSRVFLAEPGTNTYYAMAHNTVETSGSGIVSVAGNLLVEVIPEEQGHLAWDYFGLSNQDVSSQLTMTEYELVTDEPGRALVTLDGYAIADPDDVIVVAVNDEESWNVLDGFGVIDVLTDDANRTPFLYSRVFDVEAGTTQFYGVAENWQGFSGDGTASLYCAMTVHFIPESESQTTCDDQQWYIPSAGYDLLVSQPAIFACEQPEGFIPANACCVEQIVDPTYCLTNFFRDSCMNAYLECIGDTGCTKSDACNYNPDICVDDGSCRFPGCEDTAASNYVPDALCYDDSTCLYGSACFGDLDDDLAITVTDLAIFLSVFGQECY